MGRIPLREKRLPPLKTKNVLRKSSIRVYLGPESQPQLGVAPVKWMGVGRGGHRLGQAMRFGKRN